MSRILIFAGTTEGRELAEILSGSGISCDVSVATEYGSMMINESEFIHIHQGRLSEEQMRKLYMEVGCDIVIDATHPYAREVTGTILKSVEGTNIAYIRLLRDHSKKIMDESMADSVQSLVKVLEQTDGLILLTTGSKELSAFCENEELRKRLVVRVLPGIDSINLCYEAGLDGRQIIAMQGPFSKEMNKAIIEQYNIKHLVTKESGKTGGEDDKIQAALEAGIKVHILKRPVNCEPGLTYSMKETIEKLEEILGISLFSGRQFITLAGIGCGAENGLTREVETAIENADYIFGAKRMLSLVTSRAEKYPYYLAKDIIPVLDDIRKYSVQNTKIVILFSGDTGFYSGAQKLYQALKDRADSEVNILSGISSISLLASRIGISWQDARLISTHGVEERVWIPEIIHSVLNEEKTMLICSGAADARRVGEVLQKLERSGRIKENVQIFIGYQLSYPDEKVSISSIDDLSAFSEEGLITIAIINSRVESKELIPYIYDEDFIRGKVPMTKSDVRILSIARLHLQKGDILYDIGSGTGSIAIAAAQLSPDIMIYAIECKEDALSLIEANKNRFCVENITIIKALAPEGLEKLPKADAAFIGGSKGNLKAILNKLYLINPNMKIVINTVTMESIVELDNCLKAFPLENLKVSQIAVTDVKELGNYHMMDANNPVFIYSFRFKGGKDK